MGEAADRTVSEIEEVRRGLEADLRELEARLPAPLRSAKSAAGLALGGVALAALIARRLRRGRRAEPPKAEVVVRIVREDA